MASKFDCEIVLDAHKEWVFRYTVNGYQGVGMGINPDQARKMIEVLSSWLENQNEPVNKPCEHRHTHVENLTSGSICDDCGEEL
jgi:hypothetical protein